MHFGATKSFLLTAALAVTTACANGGPNPLACAALGALAGGGGGAYAGSETPGHDGDEMIGYGAAGAVVLGTAGYLICKAMEDEPAPPPPPAPAPPPPPRAETRERIVLRGVNFDFDKATIRPDAAVILDEAASQLSRRSDARVMVEGHTDATGPDGYNQGLSERRAAAVQEYLVDHGVSSSSLSTTGYGESQPVADNSTREGRALNRRVELRVSE